jgi:hypothetical protein
MLSFLKGLAGCDEVFAQKWLKLAKTPAKAMANDLEQIEVTAKSLQALLARERVRTERDNSVMEDLGFMPGTFWNGREDEAARIFVQCGAFPDPQIMPGANTVWVDFPNEGNAANRILRPKKLQQVMKVVVESWDPDWARISTYKVEIEVYPENGYLGQMVGWLTYASDRYGKLPALPLECEVTRIDNFGNLIFISSLQSITVSNPDHVAAVRRLSEVLKRAGMLAPVPPASSVVA